MAKRGLIFNTVEVNKPRYNTFNLTHDRKFSTNFGKLTPICVMDAVPGDTFTIKPSAMVRFAPMISPVMHRVNVFKHYFFVPNRILWPKEGTNNGWENFITGGEDGLDDTVWAHFRYNPESFSSGSLSDFMGLPVASDVIDPLGEDMPVSMLPFMAYNKIWNEYYRDQNLQAPIQDITPDGEQPISSEFLTVRERAWQHDYFTSALPWTQKGPEALLPLGQEAPIQAYEWENNPTEFIQNMYYTSNNAPVASGNVETVNQQLGHDLGGTPTEAYLDLNGTHYADLSQATASSINDLRRAFALQTWLERNARGGSRYTESIGVHFGVRPQDSRLQRPEFIGGCKTPVKISEVLQTSGAGLSNPNAGDPLDALTPQGNMAGHAISVGGGKAFRYTCKEHGYIIGIMSVMPVSAYQQGFPKHFTRSDKFDYYWPEFAHIGEQPVMNREIAWTGIPQWNSGIFGYVPRYSEYKFQSNTVHGDFKESLDFWHMGRKFATQPNLNEDFITMDNQEVDRVFAVQNQNVQKLWCQVLNEVTAKRPMPIFGTPKIM